MNCPICGAADARTLYRLAAGAIVECSGCSTVRRAQLVGGQAAQEMYDDQDYLDSPFFARLKVGAPREGEPFTMYKRALDRLERRFKTQSPRRRLLDVGCSFGAFLELAAERGFECEGVELSRPAAKYAREQRGLTVHVSTLETAALPAASFDVITLWDVIEHLDDPLTTLAELRRILTPDGVLLVFTINQKSLINRVGHWLHCASFGSFESPIRALYDIHHNFFFCTRTLEELLARRGFRVTETERMEAMIERWHTVELPWVLMRGCDALDVASRLVGEKYRTVLYATPAAPGAQRR